MRRGGGVRRGSDRAIGAGIRRLGVLTLLVFGVAACTAGEPTAMPPSVSATTTVTGAAGGGAAPGAAGQAATGTVVPPMATRVDTGNATATRVTVASPSVALAS